MKKSIILLSLMTSMVSVDAVKTLVGYELTSLSRNTDFFLKKVKVKYYKPFSIS